MPYQELFRVLRWQLALVALVSLMGLVWSRPVALSLALGGLCIILPNAAAVSLWWLSHVLSLSLWGVAPLLLEALKLLLTCLMFWLVASTCAELVWPAMLGGIVTASCGVVLLPLVKRR